jgi:hypothetical protein
MMIHVKGRSRGGEPDHHELGPEGMQAFLEKNISSCG